MASRLLLLPAFMCAGMMLAQGPPAYDCQYARTWCADTVVVAPLDSIGEVADLDITNRGCLLTNEREGVWMKFTVASAGRVGFTLTPTIIGGEYDFAVWGPLVEEVCPPVGPPVRCSWSAISGATGMGEVSLDLTEGAGGDGWVKMLDVSVDETYIAYLDNYQLSGLDFSFSWQFLDGASLACASLPQAAIGASATLIQVGESVDFTDLSTGDPFAWEWLIDGGTPTTSNDQHPQDVVLTEPGCHTVTLTAHSAGGTDMVEEICLIVVEVNTGIDGAVNGSRSAVLQGGVLVISTASIGMLDVLLLDATGRTVRSTRGVGSVVMEVDDLSEGRYLLRMTDAQGSTAQGVFLGGQ